MKHGWTLAIVLLVVEAASCQVKPKLQLADLTNQGKGKYWDLVYSTDVWGGINPSYATRATSNRATITYNCDYFAGLNHVVHYANVDSVTVQDRGYSDVVFNPDTFRLRDSTLFFSGHIHHILTLTPQVMVLSYEYNHHRSVKVYLPSKYQIKRVQPLP